MLVGRSVSVDRFQSVMMIMEAAPAELPSTRRRNVTHFVRIRGRSAQAAYAPIRRRCIRLTAFRALQNSELGAVYVCRADKVHSHKLGQLMAIEVQR